MHAIFNAWASTLRQSANVVSGWTSSVAGAKCLNLFRNASRALMVFSFWTAPSDATIPILAPSGIDFTHLASDKNYEVKSPGGVSNGFGDGRAGRRDQHCPIVVPHAHDAGCEKSPECTEKVFTIPFEVLEWKH